MVKYVRGGRVPEKLIIFRQDECVHPCDLPGLYGGSRRNVILYLSQTVRHGCGPVLYRCDIIEQHTRHDGW